MLIEHHAMTYWESGGIAPRILKPRVKTEMNVQLHASAALTRGERAPGSY